MSVILTTERLVLRKPEPADVEPWVSFLCSDRGKWHGCGPEHGVGRAWRAVAAFMGHWQIHGFGWFVALEKSSARPVAATGPWYPGNWPEPELGWSIFRPEDEGRGLITEAAGAVRDHLFADLGWKTLVSYFAPANARSIAVAKRLGAHPDPDAPAPFEDTIVWRYPTPKAR